MLPRSSFGLVRAAGVVGLTLGLSACAASGPRAVRYATPPPELAAPGNLLATSDPAASAPVVRQPRVIIPAPPLASGGAAQPAQTGALLDPAKDTAAPVATASTSQGATSAPVAPVAAAPTAYVASSVAPPLAGFTPQASPLLAAFDSSPRGQTPAPMDPMVQQLQRQGPGAQGWMPDFQPAYYGSYGGYYGPSYYGRSYGYGGPYGYGGYYGPSYGYGYPAVGLGLGLGFGFGLGRHSRAFGGGHYGHHGGGFHGGRHGRR